jgi:hypothetical protein
MTYADQRFALTWGEGMGWTEREVVNRVKRFRLDPGAMSLGIKKGE